MWVVSHFVSIRREKAKDGKGLGEKKIFASALSKYVFKMGRITVKPEEIFTECKLLPVRPEGAVSTGVQVNGGVNGGVNGVKPSEKELLRRLDATTELLEKPDEFWTWERVEAERKRGCEIAQYMLGLDRLEGEIRTGEEEGLTKIGRFY